MHRGPSDPECLLGVLSLLRPSLLLISTVPLVKVAFPNAAAKGCLGSERAVMSQRKDTHVEERYPGMSSSAAGVALMVTPRMGRVTHL